MSKKLKVAIIDKEGAFSRCGDIYDGLALYIWKKTAEKYKLDYELICVPRNVNKTINELEQDKFDVVLGPISITSKRFSKALFSRPYYLSKLKIHRKKSESVLMKIFRNKELHTIFTLMAFLIIMFSFAMYHYTDASVQSSFYNTFLSFFSNIREFITIIDTSHSAVTYFNYTFVVVRYLFFTLVMTQLLNIVLKTTTVITEKELKTIKEVHTIRGSSYIEVIERLGMKAIPHPDANDIVKLINDSPTPIYWLDDNNVIQETIRNSKYMFEVESNQTELITDEFVIAVNNKLPKLLHKISKTLIDLESTNDLKQSCKSYMREDTGSCL